MDLKSLFRQHSLDQEQEQRLSALRREAYHLAGYIQMNTVQCAEQHTAIQRVREALFYAELTLPIERELIKKQAAEHARVRAQEAHDPEIMSGSEGKNGK